MNLVPFTCPHHGLICHAPKSAIVECAKCGTVVDAEGRRDAVAWGARRKRARDRRAQRKARVTA